MAATCALSLFDDYFIQKTTLITSSFYLHLLALSKESELWQFGGCNQWSDMKEIAGGRGRELEMLNAPSSSVHWTSKKLSLHSFSLRGLLGRRKCAKAILYRRSDSELAILFQLVSR